MIEVLLTCNVEGCPKTAAVPITGNQLSSGVRVRECYAFGWVVRTPRGGAWAVAYCPDHREGWRTASCATCDQAAVQQSDN